MQGRGYGGARWTFANAGAVDANVPGMDVRPVDPRMDSEWEAGPIHSYRVIFWPSPGHSVEYDVLGADDVHAVIGWADAEGRDRGWAYVLYAKVSLTRPGLVWLAGIDPTVHSSPNFTRSHPLG